MPAVLKSLEVFLDLLVPVEVVIRYMHDEPGHQHVEVVIVD